MRRVVVESPYQGDIERNVRYARECVKDCLQRGEAPIASHLLFTQEGVLDDDDPCERLWGIDAGHAWISVADAVVVYADHGVSSGMQLAINAAGVRNIPVETRRLFPHSLVDCDCTGPS